MSRAVFVAGSHTDVGKTHVACGLIRAARAAGLSVDALKPVVSGFDIEDWADSDPGRLVTAMGLARSAAALNATSPWIKVVASHGVCSPWVSCQTLSLTKR